MIRKTALPELLFHFLALLYSEGWKAIERCYFVELLAFFQIIHRKGLILGCVRPLEKSASKYQEAFTAEALSC